MWPILIGAAIGLAKSHLDQQEAERQRKVQAEVTRYSPWTGMTPNTQIKNANYLSGAASGALTGAAVQQGAPDTDTPKTTETSEPPVSDASLMQNYQNQNMSPMYPKNENEDEFTRFMNQRYYGRSPWQDIRS
jgi:hypothetical protein